MIGFPLTIYHSPLPHTYTLSFLHRHPERVVPSCHLCPDSFFLIRIHITPVSCQGVNVGVNRGASGGVNGRVKLVVV